MIFFPILGVCEDQSVHPVKEKDHQYSDLGKSGDDEGNTKDKDGSCDKSHSSKVDESSSDKDKLQPGGRPMEPEPSRSLPLTPKESIQKSSASIRRALFARRRLDASASLSTREHHSPSTRSLTPQREPSPPRSLSPGPHLSPAPPSSFSPSICHVSNSPRSPDSPVRGLSPTIVQSHGLDSTGPPGSLVDISAQCQSFPRSRDWPSTARLVSRFRICFKNHSHIQ